MIIQTGAGQIIASGKITKPGVEFKEIGASLTPLCEFGINTVHERKEGVWYNEFLNCKCFYALAEYCSSFDASTPVLVCGHKETRSWTGKEGEPRSATECICDFVIATADAAPPSTRNAGQPVSDGINIAFSELPDDDDGDLPF